MNPYEYNKLLQRISMLEKQVQCLSKQSVSPTPPPVNCNSLVITTQPQPQSLLTGDSVDLTVVATGDAPITYQWKKNGLSITGATAATLSITNAVLADAGNYSVTLSNPCGILNSNTAGVSVTQSVVYFPAMWGWSDSIVSTTADIQALQGSGQFVTGHTVIADFRQNTAPKWLIMAEPLTEPQKTLWYGSDQNNGSIGTDQDLFRAPIAIGSFRVYITNYKTQQQQTPIQFKVS